MVTRTITLHSRLFRFLSGFVMTVAALAVAVGAAMPAAAAPDDGQWDPTLPKLISAGAPGDPLAIANASLAASAQATQATLDLGRKFLSTLGFGPPPEAAASRPAGCAARRPSSTSSAAAARRWACRIPGAAASPPDPSTGVDSGASTVGFDCSGLTQYLLRRRRRTDPEVLRRPVQHRPQGAAVAGQARRPAVLGPGRQPARRDLPGRRQDAGGLRR